MPVDYKNGKIYELINTETNERIYIGSTTSTLKKRLSNHKSCIKNPRRNFHSYCKDNNIQIDIKLIIDYPCNSKKELEKKEGEYIRPFFDKIQNKRIEGRTKKDYYQDKKKRNIINNTKRIL